MNDRFYLVVEDGVATGIVRIHIDLWYEIKWNWRRFRSERIKPRWELGFWRFTWNSRGDTWEPTVHDILLTPQIYRSLINGKADFVDGRHPITIEPLPASEQYWAECEFFPSPENDGVPPD